MIELFEQDIHTTYHQSSKGNQLKWQKNDFWYKADYAGYEGLSEYIISHLLTQSSLSRDEFILYDTTQIRYKSQVYLGCKSKNFLGAGEQLITLERLFQQHFGKSLYTTLFQIYDVRQRAEFLVFQVERLTGIKNFGQYLCKLLTLDAFFLNEDRHMHNIAVILQDDGTYRPAPIFDQGAGLLSDTTMDYPISGNIYDMTEEVQAKTLSLDFDEQLDVVEDLYGDQLSFQFTRYDVKALLEQETFYPAVVRQRVEYIIYDRMRKYQCMCQK